MNPAPSLLQQSAGPVIGGLMIGVCMWLVLLMHGAAAMKAQSNAHTYTVSAGPLVLHTIEKQKVATPGTRVSISLESGLIWYALCWVALGTAVSIVQHTIRVQRIHH